MSTDENNDLPRKLSLTNSVNNVDVMSIDPLKSASPDEPIPPFSIRKIYKNLLLLSIAFVLMFTAYNGMVTLQSSLNVKNNVGVNSLIITYAFLIVSSLNRKKNPEQIFYFLQFSSIALTGVCMDLFGLKWTIILAEIGYIFYIAANIKPLPILMYISK